MKKILYSIILSGLIFSGCTEKTDSIFDQTPDERIAATLTSLQSALVAAPGWKLYVYPKGLEESQDIKVGGLTYYVKFAANNRVTMVSDFAPRGSTSISATTKESGYRLKALQRPSLIFDTYTYMHIAADPDPDVSLSPVQGNGGYGYGTDFNFSFKEIKPKDTMLLEGNFNYSSAVLIKATQAEMDAAFVQGKLRSIIDATNTYAATNPYLYINAGSGLNVALGFDFANLMTSFSYVQGGNIVNKTVPSSFTINGIHLKDPITLGTYTFQDLYWDDVKKLYYILSGTTHIEFAASATPIVSQPLTTIIGIQYTTITIPPGANLPGQSASFMTRYNTAKNGMLSGPYTLTLDDIDFVFTAATKSMVVNAYVYQNGVGPYVCQYSYTYTVDGSGNFKFTKITQNGNAALVVANMNNILSLIESDQFKLNGVATSAGFLGQFASVQTPAFYFSGNLY